MPVKMECPHCKRPLNVTEAAFGKILPCPGCSQPIKVPLPSFHASHADAPRGRSAEYDGAEHNGDGASDSARPLPAGMPPMPDQGRPFDFLDGATGGSQPPRRPPNGAHGLDLSDMFMGNEKEIVFHLLPNEEVLGEVTIYHKHLSIVDKGITRITLTTQRLLYTTTRVFSPAYWLLLVLIHPLIWYYLFRVCAQPKQFGSLEQH